MARGIAFQCADQRFGGNGPLLGDQARASFTQLCICLVRIEVMQVGPHGVSHGVERTVLPTAAGLGEAATILEAAQTEQGIALMA